MGTAAHLRASGSMQVIRRGLLERNVVLTGRSHSASLVLLSP